MKKVIVGIGTGLLARRAAVVLYMAAALLTGFSVARVYATCGYFDPQTYACNDQPACDASCPVVSENPQNKFKCCCNTDGLGTYGCCQYDCVWTTCSTSQGAWCYSFYRAKNGYWTASIRCQGDGQCN